MYVSVVGIHLSAALVYGHEYRLDAACGLCHERCGAGRSDGQTGDVAASVCHDVVVERRVSLLYSEEERVGSLTLLVEHLESSALTSHVYGRAVGGES